MGAFYNLFHKDKDNQLRSSPIYLNLAKLNYSISDIPFYDDSHGTTFEKNIDDYFCHISIVKGELVFTVFFDLDDNAFKKILNTVIDKLFKKYTWCGRNFLEDRIKFNKFSDSASIDNKMKELIEVIKKESFPPLDKENVIILMNQELKKK